MHKHLCVRGRNDLIFATAGQGYLSTCFACISAEKRFEYGCFSGSLGAGCSFVLTQRGHNFGRRELLTVLGLLSLFYEHWHGPPKAQVVDGDLGVVAFCAERSLYRPFFCFKNQAFNPSVTGERLRKSHLMELSPSLY